MRAARKVIHNLLGWVPLDQPELPYMYFPTLSNTSLAHGERRVIANDVRLVLDRPTTFPLYVLPNGLPLSSCPRRRRTKLKIGPPATQYASKYA
jgi:hypothetical protein